MTDMQSISYMNTRMATILQAEKDGRLVVLPCKVGDDVYTVDNRLNSPVRVRFPSLTAIVGEMESGTKFYKTRAEAEAALRGVSEDA